MANGTGQNTSTNVTAGKPKVGGAIFRAPLGTTLPTNATSDLASSFVCLGYVSEDGLTNDNSPESDDIKAWGGETVLTVQSSKDDKFGFTLIEALNADVLKTVYGDANVTGALATGITVKANTKDLTEYVWAIDMVLRGGALKRIVIPNGKVAEVGTITYADGDAVGYEVTLGTAPDTDGNTHYEYIQKSSSGGSSGSS